MIIMPKYDEFDLDLQNVKSSNEIGTNSDLQTLHTMCDCSSHNCPPQTTYGCGSGSNGGVCALY